MRSGAGIVSSFGKGQNIFSDMNFSFSQLLLQCKTCFMLFNCSVVSNSFAAPWTSARQASLSFTISQSLLKLMSIESVMPSNHLILCCPLLLQPSIFPSIRVFSNESVLRIRWPKYCSFSISPSSKYSGLISFRIDWFDLLAVHGTLQSLFQHHSSKASILWRSAFFMVQLLHTHTHPSPPHMHARTHTPLHPAGEYSLYPRV